MSDFDMETISTMATELLEVSMAKVAAEEFNAESTDIERTMAYYGHEHNHNGELIQVDTPWAMGFADEQGTHVASVRQQAHSQYRDPLVFADMQEVPLT